MGKRSEDLLIRALKLDDKDPRKLALLRYARRLEQQARQARGRGIHHVMINGKEMAIPYSPVPNNFTKQLDAAVKRTAFVQGN